MKYTRLDLQTETLAEDQFETRKQALQFYADAEREAIAAELEDDEMDSINQLSDQEVLAIADYQIVKID